MNVVRLVMTAAALLVVNTGTAAAQGGMMPERLDPNSPKAPIARTVAELALKGERAALIEHISKVATPEYAGSDRLTSEVDAILAQIADGSLVIFGLDDLSERGAGVALRKKEARDPSQAILVAMTPKEPHKITGLRLVQLRIQ